METIKQMLKRHEREIRELEAECPHKKLSKWMDWAWAPGHFSGRVKVCENCGKVIKRDKEAGPMMQGTIDNPPRPISQEELRQLRDVIGKTIDGKPLIERP